MHLGARLRMSLIPRGGSGHECVKGNDQLKSYSLAPLLRTTILGSCNCLNPRPGGPGETWKSSNPFIRQTVRNAVVYMASDSNVDYSNMCE